MLSLVALRLRAVARKAARDRDWAAAGHAYRAYLDRRPNDGKAWVQYGHAAKESGDFETAVTAYGRALDTDPHAAEFWWHLSNACKRLGDRAAAIDCCAHAAALDPRFIKATEGLIELGARDRIPLVAARAAGGDDDARAGAEPSRTSIFAPARYDDFRQQLAIAAPPEGPAFATPLLVVIDARAALPVEVRATLSSLLDQVDARWNALVLAPPVIRDHPVASLAGIDSRVQFIADDAPLPSADAAPGTVLIAAGTVLDRQAIAWFSFAAARTDCVAAYCDHDQSVDDWRSGRSFSRPVFQTMFDPEWQTGPNDRPAALFLDRSRSTVTDWRHEDVGDILRTAARSGSVAHLPLLLASHKRLAPRAEEALLDPAGLFGLPSAPATAPADAQRRAGHDDRIEVVIQTRDEAVLLRAAIDSLRRRAARPDLLDITIVDNRSVEPATATLLERLRRKRSVKVLTLDEPFNWSRANNLAVADGTAPLLLFLNNDTEMLSADWDDTLRHYLAACDIGAVGATLLYPDRTIQHAGIIMGMSEGGPIHEGVGRAIEDGPNDRWRKARSTSAVTGAFLAMRRETFAEIAGFDAVRFAIAFNDIDLCLRVREAGLRVVMASEILATHHESKTRGLNVTRSQVAWDLDELGRLHDRWGAALFVDPAYNPHWTRRGQPFDGYRSPTLRETLRHLDLSARPAPWTPIAASDQTPWW